MMDFRAHPDLPLPQHYKGVGEMIRLKLATAVAISAFGLGSFAQAADMPIKAPPPRVETFSWTGSYIGGFGGGAWSHLESFNPEFGGTTFSQGFRYPDQDATSW